MDAQRLVIFREVVNFVANDRGGGGEALEREGGEGSESVRVVRV